MLRAEYLARSLREAGDDARVAPVLPCLPVLADMALSLWPYAWQALRSRWDVVMAMKPFPNAGIPGLLARQRGALFVVDVDDLDHGYRAGPLSRCVQILQSPFPPRADLVTVHNPHLFEYVTRTLRVPEDRVYSLGQGVNLDVFSPGSRPTDRMKSCLAGIPDRAPVVLYVAHLNVACDLEPLLSVMERVMKDEPSCHFLVAGGGPLESHYRALCASRRFEDRCHMTGTLLPEEVACLMQRAEVCLVYYAPKEVNLYRTSMKLREYLAMGRKVVANRFGDLAEFGDSVYLAQDLDEMPDTILRLLKEGGDGRESRGQAHVQVHLDWKAIGKGFHDRIQEEIVRRKGDST